MHVQVREAVFCHNYTALFRLYGTTPSMGRAVMDIFIDRFRFAALNMVVKAYKPHVPVAFVARILGFLAAARDSERECSSAVAAGISLPGSRHPVFAGKHAPQVRSHSPSYSYLFCPLIGRLRAAHSFHGSDGTATGAGRPRACCRGVHKVA